MSTEKKRLVDRLFSDNLTQYKMHKVILGDLETVLTDEFCYITELLQNANDAKAQNFNLFLQDGYLVYLNDGKPFDERNVNSIANYSNAHQKQQLPHNTTQDKASDREMTGHKDVGFKTVYKFCNASYISSGGYSFRFDEEFPWRHHSTNPVPWMITPIWTEQSEYPKVLQSFLDSNKTVFAFRLKPGCIDLLITAIRSIQNNMSMLLFLDNIKVLTFSGVLDGQEYAVKIEKTSREDQLLLLDHSRKKRETWIRKDYKMPIPDKLKQELMDMSEHSCPSKVKKENDVTLSYALECSDQLKIIDNKHKTKLFTLLPTKQQCQLPFQVNAVLLLDKSRQNILKNGYNNFLCYAIGYLQFEFAQHIAQATKLSNQCLKVIGFEATGLDSKMHEAYQAGFKKAAVEIRFLTAFRKGDQRVTLGEAVVDTTKTLYKFPFKDAPTENLIHPDVRYKSLIIQHKYGHEIDIMAICDLIEKNLLSLEALPEYYTDLLIHLFNLSKDSKTKLGIPTALKSKKIFYANDQDLYKPDLLFIPSADTDKIDTEIGLPRLHIQIYKGLLKKISVLEINPWLTACGMSEPNFDNVVRQHLIPKISDMRINRVFHVAVIKYLYHAHCQGANLKLYPELQKIELMTTATGAMQAANRCMFSSDYQPDADLEDKIQEEIFLSPLYLLMDENAPEKIKQFFQSLGVVGAIEFHQINLLVGEFRHRYPNNITEGYIEHIPNDVIKRIKDEHNLVQFSFIDHINLLGNISYQHCFFQVLTSRWRSIKQADQSAIYENTRTKTPIKPFIPYYLSHHAIFVTLDGRLFKARKTYHPKFAIFEDTQIPVIDTGVSLSTDQAAYLGVRRRLKISDVIRLFRLLCQSELNDVILEKYHVLFEEILTNDYSDKDIDQIWAANIVLPASDQTFQPLSDLKCFDAHDEAVPFNKTWLKQIPGMTRDEINQLSEKLNIEVVKQMNVRMVFHKRYDPPLKKIKSVLPLFSIYLQKETFKSEKENLASWAEKVSGLVVYYANEILDAHDEDHKVAVHYDSRLNQLTYTGHWEKGDILRRIANRVTEKILGLPYKYSDELRDLISYSDKDISLWKKRNKITDKKFSELNDYWLDQLSQYEVKDEAPRKIDARTPLKIKIKIPFKRQLSAKDQELATMLGGQSVLSQQPHVVQNEHGSVKKAKVVSAADIVEQAESSEEKVSNPRIINAENVKQETTPPNFLKKMILKKPTLSLKRDNSDTKSQTPPEKRKSPKKIKQSNTKKQALSFEPALKLEQLLNFSTQLPKNIVREILSDLPGSCSSSEQKRHNAGNMSAVKAMKENEVDQKTRDLIGLHGETICYRLLYDHYYTKYSKQFGRINVQDHALGFKMFDSNNTLLVQIDWHDKPFAQNPSLEKSTSDHDIMILKPKKECKYIEVKTTVEAEKRAFTLTGAELNAMNRYGSRYRFFRVLSVMRDQPVVEVLKNPRQMIEDEQILAQIKSIELRYTK